MASDEVPLRTVPCPTCGQGMWCDDSEPGACADCRYNGRAALAERLSRAEFALATAAMPLEVLLATECGPERSALHPDVKEAIRQAVPLVRAFLADAFLAGGGAGGKEQGDVD